MGIAPWALGVVLAVLAALCAALGDNLVKLSFLRAKRGELEGVPQPPVFKRPLWLLGIFCMIGLNTSLSLASYAFADASITIPFGGLHICFNIPLAHFLNHERCTMRACGYNLLILLGVMVVLITGNHDSNFFSAQELAANVLDPGFLTCTVLLGGALALLTGHVKSPKQDHQRLALTLMCGILGSVTQVFAKAMSECLKDGALTAPFTWISVLLTLACAGAQVVLLNKCLDRYAAVFVVPVVNATIIVLGSLYAAVYFQEMARWSWHSQVFVPMGIFIVGVGIALLSTEPESELHEDEEDVELGESSSMGEALLVDEGEGEAGQVLLDESMVGGVINSGSGDDE